MKKFKAKPKHYIFLALLLVFLLSSLTGCSEVKQVFNDTDQLVSEMTKLDLMWTVLIMSLIGNLIN